MDVHLNEEERDTGNRRNGKQRKTVKTSQGEVSIETPRNRHSSFEPEIVKKRETILADNLKDKILTLYGLGMSTGDISAHIAEMYNVARATHISAATLSAITDLVIPRLKEWQNRPLESLYCIVWMYAMRMPSYYKVREEGRTVSAVYTTF